MEKRIELKERDVCVASNKMCIKSIGKRLLGWQRAGTSSDTLTWGKLDAPPHTHRHYSVMDDMKCGYVTELLS